MKATVYRKSFLATLVNILGLIFGVFAVMCLNIGFTEVFNGDSDGIGDIIGGIIILIPCVLLECLAAYINERKKVKVALKGLREQGLEPKLSVDADFAFDVYTKTPTKAMYRYLSKINPHFAEKVDLKAANGKNRNKKS